jgi:hypothetical protein
MISKKEAAISAAVGTDLRCFDVDDFQAQR